MEGTSGRGAPVGLADGRARHPRSIAVAAMLFGLLFASYGWFAQGGGWNQNARFAQVRSLVETGSFSANPYVAYRASRPGDPASLVHVALPDRAPPPPDPHLLATLDLSYFDGRFVPNKPPGVSLLAAPAYGVVRTVEGGLGIDPDDWFVLGVNAHLATLLSVGLMGALVGVLVFGISQRLLPGVPLVCHAAGALSVGLATLCLPFSTILMDHVVVAGLALVAFALLMVRRPDPPPLWALGCAGLACGSMVVVNYTALLIVGVLAGYAVWRARPDARGRTVGLAVFVAGGLPFALFLAWYHHAFFGGVFETANSHQPAFMNESSRPVFLGMIGVPDPVVAWRLLFSAYRGLFVSSPVLLLGVLGLVHLLRSKEARPEALVCASVFGVLWLLNASFNGWYGGYSFGPRYLIPAIPFLALPLAWSFWRWPAATSTLAVMSAAAMLLATAVSPQVPAAVANPWQDFMLPLASGEPLTLGREHWLAPVSANATGVYEGTAHFLFGPESEPAHWASFNLGELVWPESWLSVTPLLGLWAIGLVAVLRASRTRETVERRHADAAVPDAATSGIRAA